MTLSAITKKFVVIAMLAVAGVAEAKTAKLEGCRPNIILVMTDDQGMGDLACLGNPFLKTPDIDRLYAQSTRFTDFHVSSSCAPTRAALMSGRHEFRVGVTHTIMARDRRKPSGLLVPHNDVFSME